MWKLRDITFHPFHMHESPVRLLSLPSCATSVTNMWQVRGSVCAWERVWGGRGREGTLHH